MNPNLTRSLAAQQMAEQGARCHRDVVARRLSGRGGRATVGWLLIEAGLRLVAGRGDSVGGAAGWYPTPGEPIGR